MQINAKLKIKNAKRKTRSALFVFNFSFLIFNFALPVRAQVEEPPPPPISQQKESEIETIRVDTDLVDLNISVFSRDPHHAVGELRQQDFTVLDNDQPGEILFFASASAPFDLVLLIDLSGSTSEKLNLIRKSARRFVEATRPADRVGIITFTDQPVVVSQLTTDRKQLIENIKKIHKPSGGTNFWDALRFVLKNILGAKDKMRRQAVVVMSDGVDNALPDVPGPGSSMTYEELLEMVKASEAIVLPIYLDTELEMLKQRRATADSYTLARWQLAALATESGSLLYHARKVEDLDGVYEQVIRDLGMIYSIGYRPSQREPSGAWRNVTVRLVNRPGLAARTRRGYYAK